MLSSFFKIILKSYKVQAAAFVLLWMLGLVLDAQMMLSIAMIALVVLSVFQWENKRPILRKNFLKNWKAFWRSPAYWCLMLFFVIVAMTWPYSTESPAYMHNRLMVKLPFLLLPFALFSVPKWTKRELHLLFYAFIALLIYGSILVLSEYSSNFEHATAAIGQGASITHEVNHIRYSLMVVVGLMLLIHLWRKKFVYKFDWEPYVQLLVGLFLVGFLHVLAARSGLVLLYLLFGFYLLEYMYQSGKIFFGVAILVALFSLPILSYQIVPSFKNKVDYALWDYEEFQKGNKRGYSDGQRWLSWEAGFNIAKEHPYLGVGAGDLKTYMWDYYEDYYLIEREMYKMPHNQFLTVWAGSGLLGLALFLWAYCAGLWYKRKELIPIYVLFKGMLFLSFIVENTIENSVGIALFLLFELLFLKYIEVE